MKCLWTTTLLFLVLVTACAVREPTADPTQTPDIDATVESRVLTALPTATPTPTPNIEGTVEARLQATLGAIPTATEIPTATVIPTQAPTVTPIPTSTPLPTATATPIQTPTQIPPTATPLPTPTPTPVPSTPTPTPKPTPTPSPSPGSDLETLIEEVRSGVVRIETDRGIGSGVIFETRATDRSALVLTNYHFVEGASRVDVVVNDFSTYAGVLLGFDHVRDLAVLRICCDAGFKPLSFGDATDLKVGTLVIAMGYALGLSGGATVTSGIVSAVRYEGDTDRWVIQTDAALNPGNSGGPLFSSSGEVVGINTFKLESTSGGRPVEGLGFAISEQTVRSQLRTLTSGIVVTAPTPTPQPNAPGGIYSSEKYWYTIEVPSGWRLDSSDADGVSILEPLSGSVALVSVFEINSDLYPDLDSYVAAFEPTARDGGTNFSITSNQRVRVGLPVEAHQFIYRFTLSGGQRVQVQVHWYVLGKYLVKMYAAADEPVWSFQEYSEVRSTLEEIQGSFQPSSYTSTTHGYSLAYPLGWEVEERPGFDFSVHVPGVWVGVYILPRQGYLDVASYGSRHTISDAEILSESAIYTGRSNPSYRWDYTYSGSTSGRAFRGATLITLSGENAVWVQAGAFNENWDDVQGLVEEIFLRFAVKP